MAIQEIINIGTSPNDGQGDPLRTAFNKINDNFTNLFASFTNFSNVLTTGNTAGQIIFESPANTFSQGQFYIQSTDTSTSDSQTIQLYSQVSADSSNVKFTAYGSTFFGNCVSSFDMTVDGTSGNVQILANPISNNTVLHFIGSQVMWLGNVVPGLAIALDGYSNSVMATQSNIVMATNQGS